MIATGRLPPDALPLEMQGSSDCVLGLEYSGHVQGSGKRVMGILPVKALATRVLTHPEYTWEVSHKAATLPVLSLKSLISYQLSSLKGVLDRIVQRI